MARNETTQPVTVSLADKAAPGPAAVAAVSPIVRLRFQIAPGADAALVVEAPYDLPWRVVHFDREATGGVATAVAVEGVVKKGQPIELALPLGAVALILSRAMLEIDWGIDDANKPITAQYMLAWNPLEDRKSRGYALATLGYLTGYLGEVLAPAASPGRSACEQQAILQFQADAGLEQTGELTPALLDALRAEAAKR